MNVVALIPARSGSKRVKDKNIRPLCGHPLIAYTICAAIDSGVFAEVIISTDSSRYAATYGKYYGPGFGRTVMRPADYAADDSPDIEWVRYTLNTLEKFGFKYDAFSILRPTSPFRTPDTIIRAWSQFLTYPCDSLRAVERCSQHPGKMWVRRGAFNMSPLFPFEDDQPWHSMPTQELPEIFVQNASLEIARTSVVELYGNISGNVIRPFLTKEHEGFDINTEYDFKHAKYLVETGEAKLPEVKDWRTYYDGFA